MFKEIQTSNHQVRLLARLFVATALGLASATAAFPSGSSGFTTIDVSGAGTGADQGTVATILDAAGDVAGIYRDSRGDAHAFVLPSGGVVTPFDAPGEADGTFPLGFDTAGDIVGIFEDSNNRIHGFLRAVTTGTITTLDVTGEDTGKMEGTFPVGINGAGEIAGNFSTTLTTSSGKNSFSHGFIRDTSGTISTFDAVPLPATYGSTNPGTYVICINATGEVAGFYIDAMGAEHGFLRDAAGKITTFEAPNAATGSEQGTLVTGIDAAGDVIGAYTDTSNAVHGFVRSASTGTITVIDAPGAGTATYQGTYPDAFDEDGDVFGSFTDANNAVHGFVLPSGGAIATYDAPGSSSSDAMRKAASDRLDRKLRQLGKSYGLSFRSRRPSSPLMKLRSLLSKVGAVKTEGTGLLNGNGPNPSGTASYGNLFLNSVNASGEIVGIYTDGNYVFHGYLRATDGTITNLDDSSAGTSAKQGTGSLTINAAGMIAGTYADAKSVLHGFLYDSSTLTATTTTLTPVPTPNPSVYQEPVTLSASVSSSGGVPQNGENVTFMSGATSLGTAPLTSGTAVLTTTNLGVGADPITAVYGGDANFAGSTSAALSQTVNQASSATTLKSSLNPSISEQSVTLTANISGEFSGVATGTVTFNNGSASLGNAPVSNNMATLAITTLPVGTDSITADYSGDGNFTGSSSSALSQVVNPIPGFGQTSGSPPGSISIQPGATSENTATISITGTNGFSGTVNLACAVTTSMTGVNDMPTCSLNPTSVALSGTTAQTSTLTVSTTAASSAENDRKRLLGSTTGGTALALIAIFLVPKRRRNWVVMLGLFILFVSVGAIGCGGGSGGGGNTGTTPGTYTITVTGTSGTISTTVGTVTVTVQ